MGSHPRPGIGAGMVNGGLALVARESLTAGEPFEAGPQQFVAINLLEVPAKSKLERIGEP